MKKRGRWGAEGEGESVQPARYWKIEEIIGWLTLMALIPYPMVLAVLMDIIRASSHPDVPVTHCGSARNADHQKRENRSHEKT